MPRPLIQLESVSVHFGTHRVIKDANLALSSSRIYALVGPNAAGKTTFLHLLAGLLEPSQGSLWFEGSPYSRKRLAKQQQIGLLTSPPAFVEEFTIEEWVAHLATMYGLTGKKKRLAVAESLMLCRLQDKKQVLIQDCSNGVKRRIGIAGAIVHKPKLILLDEPTSELDPHNRQMILEVIQQFRKEETVVFSTHLLDEALLICDQVLSIQEGKIAQPPLRTLSESLGQVYWVEFHTAPLREQLLTLPGTLDAQHLYGNVFQILLSHDGKSLNTLLQHAIQATWGIKEARPMRTELITSLWSETTQGSALL